MKSEVEGINERFQNKKISIKEILSMIEVTLEDRPKDEVSLFPYEIFEGLDALVARTVHGSKIERFRPKEGRGPFHTFEIHTEEGDILGHLNMIYLRNPIPCYYLVYVEVLPPFRGRGLGNKILRAFREFAEEKGVVGLLDNIIPDDEPTYGIYTKLGWRGIGELIGKGMVNGEENYMVFVPTSMRTLPLKDKLVKLLFKVKKKRPIIDMRDNEAMVKRTIEEFRSVYKTLGHLFEVEISNGTATPFMRFLFTKFMTKMLGFRRRIADLLGYTGGESLEQITVSDHIKNLPLQPYSLWWAKEEKAEIWGEEEIVRELPENLKKNPTLYIESLPLYRRPYLTAWMEERRGLPHDLKISDLLELGFDPTKLREFHHEKGEFIFERVTPHFIPSLKKRRRFLTKMAEHVRGIRFPHATLQINPPLVILQDRGNVYVLRRKVEGIHSEEALEQLRTAPHLKDMNRSVGIDRVVIVAINEIRTWLIKEFSPGLQEEVEDLAFFIPWNLERNIPRVTVEIKGISLEALWIA